MEPSHPNRIKPRVCVGFLQAFSLLPCAPLISLLVAIALSIFFQRGASPPEQHSPQPELSGFPVEAHGAARVVQRGLFTAAECEAIVALQDHAIKLEEKVKVFGGDGKTQILDTSVRSARKAWLCSHTAPGVKDACYAKQKLNWVMARLKMMITSAVKTEAWATEIKPLVGGGGAQRPLQSLKLDAVVLTYEVGDFHAWHLDATPRAESHPRTRLLTVRVLDARKRRSGRPCSGADQ